MQRENSKKKIKIAHIITRMIVGGAQENTLLSCRAFGARPEYGVALVTGPALGPEGNLLETAGRDEPFELMLLPQLRREINPLRDLIALVQLWRFLRRGKFDLVHTHSSKAGILGRWAAWLAGVPVRLHTVHGWGFHDYQQNWRRRLYVILERRTARITTRLIAVSKENVEKGLSAGIGKKEQYEVIYSGIDLAPFQNSSNSQALRQSLGIPEGKIVVGTVGRLSEQKNPLLFVRIARRLAQSRKDLFFLMVGDGPLRREVEKEIREGGLTASFLLTGIRRDAAALTQLIDLFLLPSRWEGLPRALLGAMAAGKPVAASRTDGITEVVRHNENGFLVSPDDEKGWGAAAQELLQSPDKRARLGEAAQKTVTQRFSDVKMVQDLENLYQRTLRESGTRR